MHRGQEKRARQQFGDQSADRITNEHRVETRPPQTLPNQTAEKQCSWGLP
jgi:hypothetical protein